MAALSAIPRQQQFALNKSEQARRLRVLIVTHYYSGKGGGIELVAHALARQFAAMCDVQWAATDSGHGLPTDVPILPLAGTNVVEHIVGVPFPILSPLSVVRLRAAVRWADVIHIHDALYTTSQAAFLLAKFYRKPIIVTQHIGDVPYRSWLLTLTVRIMNRVVSSALLRNASEAVFISDIVRHQFQKKLRLRVARSIYNGVDQNVFCPQPATRRFATRENFGLHRGHNVALFVGRFVEKKGLHKLHALARETPETRWVFIGRGPIDPRRWNAPNVRVCDQMQPSQLADWYNAADLLVLPSVGEGFPLVVQEAIACGLPCLVSEEIRMACPEAGDAADFSGTRW